MAFNSREYSYCDVQATILGRPLTGLRGIEYTAKKSKEALFGAGVNPKSIQHGRREYEGTLTVLQSEMEALNRAAKEAGYTDCLDLEFDIVVTYTSGETVTTDIIRCASITEFPKGMKEGDLNSEHALPFIALGIDTNVTA
ncbi:MAG: hypothetical protein K2J57_03080 [Bacteroidales bacterium]|nr:hypothetical protein [Bacteroidales bacterium]MDE6694799.1 hypothetical protein [Bacteroidales bacterium]